MIMKMYSLSLVVNRMTSRAVFLPKIYFSSYHNLFPVSKHRWFPLTSAPKLAPSRATANQACDYQKSNRTFEKQLPSPWTDQFHSISIDSSEMDALRKEIDVLTLRVKSKLMSFKGTDSTKKRILMIYLLVSLGLAHYFEEEIYEILEEDYRNIHEMMDGEDNLYTVSTIFWIFRRYRHNISSDVFTKFKGSNGKFQESLIKDGKGMLSLYEAAHLGTTGDYILDEALSFTTSHLESLAACETCPPHFSVHIQNSLLLAQHWNMNILVAIQFISFYEHEKDHDEMLLRFGKLNSKLLQLHNLQELKILTKWYKTLNLDSKLPPYFRDRIVENYCFALFVFYEPHQSRERMLLTRFFIALGILDDTFDRYASLTEAEILANSLRRWSPDHAIESEPDYLKFVFHTVLHIFREFERELRPEGGSYKVNATIEEKAKFKEVTKANFEFAKWAHDAHMPSFEEYIEVGGVEITVYAVLAGMFMSMDNIDTKEAYEWLKFRPNLPKSLAINARIRNDLTGFKDDMSRGSIINAVNCYIKQYGVHEHEAFRELNKLVVEAKKVSNEEFLTTVGVSRGILKSTIDLARMIVVTYNVDEGFTQPQGKFKEYMTSLFVNQICL